MEITIAPEVFTLAATNDACLQMLTRLEQDKDKHCYVTTRRLQQLYGEFVSSRNRSAGIRGDLARTIARHLVSGTAFKQLRLDPLSELPMNIRQIFLGCDLTDVEQHLICIARDRANARTSENIGPSLVLVLSCSSTKANQCLYQQQVRDQLCQLINALEIHCAEDRQPIHRFHKELRDITNQQQHDARFQDQCTLWLTRKFNCAGSTGVRVLGHEIDSFGEVEAEGLHQLIIGESKLIHGTKDKVDPHDKALKQLSKRIETLLEKFSFRDAATGIRLECFVFSNIPTEYDPDVKSRAKEIEAQYCVGVHLIRVEMPSRWQDDPAWNLRDEHFMDVS